MDHQQRILLCFGNILVVFVVRSTVYPLRMACAATKGSEMSFKIWLNAFLGSMVCIDGIELLSFVSECF